MVFYVTSFSVEQLAHLLLAEKNAALIARLENGIDTLLQVLGQEGVPIGILRDAMRLLYTYCTNNGNTLSLVTTRLTDCSGRRKQY